jgi:hypothetical protein
VCVCVCVRVRVRVCVRVCARSCLRVCVCARALSAVQVRLGVRARPWGVVCIRWKAKGSNHYCCGGSGPKFDSRPQAWHLTLNTGRRAEGHGGRPPMRAKLFIFERGTRPSSGSSRRSGHRLNTRSPSANTTRSSGQGTEPIRAPRALLVLTKSRRRRRPGAGARDFRPAH